MVKKSKLTLLLVAVLVLALVFAGCKKEPAEDPGTSDTEAPITTAPVESDPEDTDAPGTDAPGTDAPETGGILTPDYPLPPVDTGAETIGGEQDTGKLETPQGGGSVGLVYSTDVEIDLADGEIALRFDNPTRSNKSIVVSISIQDNVVARSGLINPGSRILQLELNEDGKEKLTQAGVYEGKFLVDNYDPVSGEKAIVDIEIPITITVK